MSALPLPKAGSPRSAFRPGVARRRVRRMALAACPLLLLLLLPSSTCGAAAEGIYPLILRDDRGVAVTLRRQPARVVSLAPSLTEIVFFLGREGTLVGVTRFCNYPAAAARLPRVGGVTDPDVERIVAARPDLVLCTVDGNPRDRVRALEEAGIPCFAVNPQDLAGVLALVERVGILLGVPGKARAEANELEARAGRASARGRGDDGDASGPGRGKAAAVGPGEGPKALFILSVSPLIAAGRGTFLDEILRRAGARNAASSFAGRYPRLSTEDLIALGPDVVFIAAMAGVEKLPPEVTRWTEVPAFRDGEVHSLDGDLVTRPGPRMVAALEEVSRAVASWRKRHGAVSPGDKGGGP